MSKFSEPIPANLSKGAISAFAEKFADTVGYKPGGDIFSVVSKLGGRVRVKDYTNPQLGHLESVVIESPKSFDIFVPAHTSSARDRFTIAHELGHYVLHFLWHLDASGKQFDFPIKASRYGSNQIEWEANWFAASFLMPEAEFKSRWAALSRDTVLLAREFGVSPKAVQVRATSLRLN